MEQRSNANTKPRGATGRVAGPDNGGDPGLLPAYLRDMVRSDLIDADEERALALEIQQGARDAAALAGRLDRDLLREISTAGAAELGDPAGWSSREGEDFCRRLRDWQQTEGQLPEDLRQRAAAIVARMKRAREALTLANLRLVVHFAQRYPSRSLSVLDRIQEGNIGLMRAVDLFDPDRGNRFSSYAVWWIRQAIARGVSVKERTIRIPSNQHERRALVERTRQALALTLWRPPSTAEIAERIGCSAEEVQEALEIVSEPQSLDQLDDELFRERGIERLADPRAERAFAAVGEVEASQALATAMQDKLSPREQRILILRFGLSSSGTHTLEQTGRQVGLSRERVRQLEAQALETLRDSKLLTELNRGQV